MRRRTSVGVLILLSSISIGLCAQLQEEVCQKFLDAIADGSVKLNDKVSGTFEFCQFVLKIQPEPTPILLKAESNPLDSLGLKGHRALRPLNFKGQGECAIILFQSQSFQGQEHKLHKTVRRYPMAMIKSIRTLGPCCWRIYTKRNGKMYHTVLRGNEDLPSPSDWNWNHSTVINALDLVESC